MHLVEMASWTLPILILSFRFASSLDTPSSPFVLATFRTVGGICPCVRGFVDWRLLRVSLKYS